METKNRWATRSARICERIEELAAFSELEGALFRPFCSPSAKKVNALVLEWAKADDLIAQEDAIGNIRVQLQVHDPEKANFYMGSHLDSVINAGKYDGPLGFLIAYETLVEIAQQEKELPFNPVVVAFADEEGVRYHTSYLGSKTLTGNFDLNLLEKKDADGISMQEAIRVQGFSPEKIPNAAIDRQKVLGFYEVHIEQGPVLEAKDLAVGLVRDIYGQARIVLEFIGKAGHAGTVPMHLREDALCAFSEFNLAMEAYANTRREKLVATAGICRAKPGASNVIPDHVFCTLDIRSGDEAILQQALEDIQQMSKDIAAKRSVDTKWKNVQTNSPVLCDLDLKKHLREAIEANGLSTLELSSGAGHDAVEMSKVGPVAMLFVRCKEGISHNPAEYCAPDDIHTAFCVSMSFINKLIQQHSK